MHEILFRGKRIDNGEWIYGDLIHDKRCFSGEDVVQIFDTNGVLGYLESEVIPETAGQYTGLTDKNETKIFEGDIVKAWGQRPMYVHFNGETLTWEMTDVGVPIFEVNHLLNTIDLAEVQIETVVGEMHTEVIGNIHDNPELLKGENDA